MQNFQEYIDNQAQINNTIDYMISCFNQMSNDEILNLVPLKLKPKYLSDVVNINAIPIKVLLMKILYVRKMTYKDAHEDWYMFDRESGLLEIKNGITIFTKFHDWSLNSDITDS